MAYKKTEEHHFLQTVCTGRYTILSALPGQTLKKTPVTTGIVVEGCEKYRKSFPVGSVFGTTTLKKASRKMYSFYKVEDLYYLGDVDSQTDLIREVTRQELIQEYQDFLNQK